MQNFYQQQKNVLLVLIQVEPDHETSFEDAFWELYCYSVCFLGMRKLKTGLETLRAPTRSACPSKGLGVTQQKLGGNFLTSQSHRIAAQTNFMPPTPKPLQCPAQSIVITLMQSDCYCKLFTAKWLRAWSLFVLEKLIPQHFNVPYNRNKFLGPDLHLPSTLEWKWSLSGTSEWKKPSKLDASIR